MKVKGQSDSSPVHWQNWARFRLFPLLVIFVLLVKVDFVVVTAQAQSAPENRQFMYGQLPSEGTPPVVPVKGQIPLEDGLGKTHQWTSTYGQEGASDNGQLNVQVEPEKKVEVETDVNAVSDETGEETEEVEDSLEKSVEVGGGVQNVESETFSEEGQEHSHVHDIHNETQEEESVKPVPVDEKVPEETLKIESEAHNEAEEENSTVESDSEKPVILEVAEENPKIEPETPVETEENSTDESVEVTEKSQRAEPETLGTFMAEEEENSTAESETPVIMDVTERSQSVEPITQEEVEENSTDESVEYKEEGQKIELGTHLEVEENSTVEPDSVTPVSVKIVEENPKDESEKHVHFGGEEEHSHAHYIHDATHIDESVKLVPTDEKVTEETQKTEPKEVEGTAYGQEDTTGTYSEEGQEDSIGTNSGEGQEHCDAHDHHLDDTQKEELVTLVPVDEKVTEETQRIEPGEVEGTAYGQEDVTGAYSENEQKIESKTHVEVEEETPKDESEKPVTVEGDEEHYHSHEVKHESSQFIQVVKHLSYSLLFFLPEHLQDSILDVNDALILTGIIALALVSVCVPYFFIETYMAVRPLKKKVVELNRNLWKVSTAYENQQEDFEAYKKKALAYDEDKDTIEKLETNLHLAKQLDAQHQKKIKELNKELRHSYKAATDVEQLVETKMAERDKALEEVEKMKGYLLSVQTKFKQASEALETAQAESSSATMNNDILSHANNLLELKLKALEKDVTDYKALLQTEGEKRKITEVEAEKYLSERDSLQEELTGLKDILHKYEVTTSNLTEEISVKENELLTLKESLGEDSPLVEAAELSAKLKVAQESATALQLRVESLTLEHGSLTQTVAQLKKTTDKLQFDKEQAENRLEVLDSYFTQKEEELRTMVEKYEAEKQIRGLDETGLISKIEEKDDVIRELNGRINNMKQELEDTKLAHRTESRALEAKEHENFLLLCQSERKLVEARKEGEVLRQKLTQICREKTGNGDATELDGNMNFFPMIPADLIPPPLPDDVGPTYIGLGNFVPPPPLDDDDDDDDEDLHDQGRQDREPLRPVPVGRLSPAFSDHGMNGPLSPIGRGYDYSEDRRPPSRESWINGNDRGSDNRPIRGGHPRTSSPINHVSAI